MHFQDLTCIISLPIAPNSVLLSGRQSKLVQMDLVTQKEQRLVYFIFFVKLLKIKI